MDSAPSFMLGQSCVQRWFERAVSDASLRLAVLRAARALLPPGELQQAADAAVTAAESDVGHEGSLAATSPPVEVGEGDGGIEKGELVCALG